MGYCPLNVSCRWTVELMVTLKLNGYKTTVMDAVFRTIHYFQFNNRLYRFFYNYDDLEVCNPLGSKVKVQ